MKWIGAIDDVVCDIDWEALEEEHNAKLIEGHSIGLQLHDQDVGNPYAPQYAALIQDGGAIVIYQEDGENWSEKMSKEEWEELQQTHTALYFP